MQTTLQTTRKYARLVRIANQTKGEPGMLACYHLANALSLSVQGWDGQWHYNEARKYIRRRA